MNKQRNTPAKTPRSDSSEAGGQHEGLRHPIDDDQRVEQRLDDVGLDDQGDVLDDQLRDRRGSGTQPAERANKQDVKRQRH